MSFLSDLFRIAIRQPLFNLLVFFYVYVTGHDLGFAIILLTILIMLLLWPLQKKAIKAQLVIQELQPKIKEIEKQYKNDKPKQAEEMMKLYKSQEINPFAGILMMFLQWPILIAMYRMFIDVFKPENMSLLYGFMPKPEVITTTFLGIINLKEPSIPLAIMAGLLQILQIRMMTKKTTQTKNSQKFISYGLSALIVVFLFRWPSALALYYCVFTVFNIFQQKILYKNIEKHGQKGIIKENPKTI